MDTAFVQLARSSAYTEFPLLYLCIHYVFFPTQSGRLNTCYGNVGCRYTTLDPECLDPVSPKRRLVYLAFRLRVRRRRPLPISKQTCGKLFLPCVRGRWLKCTGWRQRRCCLPRGFIRSFSNPMGPNVYFNYTPQNFPALATHQCKKSLHPVLQKHRTSFCKTHIHDAYFLPPPAPGATLTYPFPSRPFQDV